MSQSSTPKDAQRVASKSVDEEPSSSSTSKVLGAEAREAISCPICHKEFSDVVESHQAPVIWTTCHSVCKFCAFKVQKGIVPMSRCFDGGCSLCEGPNGKRSIQTETALLTNIPFCDAISILRHTCGRFVQQQAQASQLHYHTTANAAHRASAIIQQQGNSMYLQNIATIEEKTKLSRQNFRLMQDVDLLRRENHKLRNKLTRTSTTGPTQFMDASSTRSNIDDHAKVDTSGHSISSFPTTKRQKRTEEDVETAEI